MAKNSHLIEARYVGPTNAKGSRVRLFSHRFERDTVIEGYNHSFSNTSDQAAAMLERMGYTIECAGEMRHGYFFVVSEFLPLRDAAAKLRKANRKHTTEYVVQGNYGQGWEDLTASEDHAEAKANLRDYRANDPAPTRLIRRRVKRDAR